MWILGWIVFLKRRKLLELKQRSKLDTMQMYLFKWLQETVNESRTESDRRPTGEMFLIYSYFTHFYQNSLWGGNDGHVSLFLTFKAATVKKKKTSCLLYQ